MQLYDFSGYWLIQSLVLNASVPLKKIRDACTSHALLHANSSSAGMQSFFLHMFYILSTKIKSDPPYQNTGCVLVHGRSMERGLVGFMLVTATSQQGKKERWGFWASYLSCHHGQQILGHAQNFLKLLLCFLVATVRWIWKEKRDGKELPWEIYTLLWTMGSQSIGKSFSIKEVTWQMLDLKSALEFRASGQHLMHVNCSVGYKYLVAK